MQINKSRCDGGASGVYLLLTFTIDLANGNNRIAINGNIAGIGFAAVTINKQAITDNQIMGH
jgi:hypothetical protein